MSERKFARGLGKPGTAAQMRETVSQVVRESTVQRFQNKPHLVEPLDFEKFLIKNKTVLQNDPQRELLLYPQEDITQVVSPRKFRTVSQTFPSTAETENCSLFSKQCINSYSSSWNLIHYKYNAYSGSYADLPQKPQENKLQEEIYEVDIDTDALDELNPAIDNITKEGFLLKGPEIGSERSFVNIGSKSFKKRYCYLRQEVDGTYMLEMFKDEKKGEAKVTIVMDFCTDVIKNLKRGKFCFELRMTAGHKSYLLAAESESDLKDWLSKLSSVLQHNKIQEEKRAASLERERSTPPPSPQTQQPFGTLKGLDQSMNPQLMRYGRETEVSIAASRRDHRKKIFQVYPNLVMNVKPQNSSQDQKEPYREVFGQRVLLRCESIRLKLQVVDDRDNLCQVEPYHTTLCLFDAKNGRKLTENFHFDVNSTSIRNTVNNGMCGDSLNNSKVDLLPGVSSEWMMYPRQALLSIMNPHSDIFLLVRIEKVLQGGIGQSSEPYVKANKDPRISQKVYRNIAMCCQRLGRYRMPFAWAARPLFRLYSNELDTTSDFHAIYRQEPNKISDEEMVRLLSEYRKPDKFNKFTVIPGSLEIKVSAINDLPPNTLSTSLAPLKPFPVPPTSEPTVEIAELEGLPDKDVNPYTIFINHLFVYPLSLNFDTQKTFSRARNIACVIELRDSDNEEAKGLQCIYGRPGQPLLVSQASCAVLHHNTFPVWYEEVKIRLPTNILYSHHLLFTFYHISCDTKKKENGVENCVGYAWLPLLQKGKLNVDAQTIPVASQLLPGYLSVHPFGLGKGSAGPEITWIDSQRPIFTVGFNLVSTINTKDQHLFNLFNHAERLLDPKPSALPSETETCKILKALHAIHLTTLITFLPTLFNQLFALLVATNSEEIGLNIIRVLINLVDMIYNVNRKEILQAYVKFVYVSPESKKNITVHEEMCKHLPTILHPNNTDFLVVNKFMHHSDFFFEIIVKGMAQHLLSTGRIKMHRHERFSTEYLSRVENLMHVLIPYVLNKYKEMPLETRELNKNMAYFLKKCLSLVDRGFVFKLINNYMDKFNPGDAKPLQECKFSFLEIICNHEHYIALNLPIQFSKLSPRNRSPDCSKEFTLSEEFCKHHFIVGLLLQEIKTSLNEVTHIRKIALITLKNLLAKHELDDRYKSKGQMNRIAIIYLPWLGIALDNLARLDMKGELDDEGNDSIHNRISSSSSYLFGKSSAVSESTPRNHRFTLHFDKDSPIHMRNSAFFEAIAGQSLVNGNSLSIDSDISTMSGDAQSTISQDPSIIREERLRIDDTKSHNRTTSHVQRYDKLQPQEVKDVLLIFLFVVKYLSEEQLTMWWQNCSETDIYNFFSILEICLHCFKYVGKRNIKTNDNDNAKAKSKKAHTLPARMNPSEMNHENTSTLVIHTTRENLISTENEVLKKQQAILEQHLATEIGLITLDCMGLYCMHFKKNLMSTDGDNDIMKKLFDIYLTFIQIGQSENLFKHVFAALRSFINNFSLILFQGNAVLCGRLCYELLKCCNSRLASIRQESCAILYLLMRSNFEFTGRKGLTRVHLQVIISVSQMLGNIVGLNNARFQESLSLINSYASSDKAMKGSGFPVEVKDLTKRVRTVLMATVQMREHHHDPEMLVDLQHSLANSYASTPELRHTWLETMTRHHVKDGNYSEAACCQLHIAALMAEYLKLKKIQKWGAEKFEGISSNIPKDEKGLKLDSGVQDIQYGEITLLEQLETCADFLHKAERYEVLGELYKLIIPIYEKKRNYDMLRKCYNALADNYEKVVETNRSCRRLLGRYYRVGFYGQAYFEDENGLEYVYKEPKVTSLSEISERLFKQYCDKFGPDCVKMIQDSSPVNQADLDPKLAYIQVTHVRPYFEKSELEERQTEFEQNHDINCFMFETPFTKDGKARGNPEDQWKRRNILTTSYSFPYVKKRILVVSRRIVELTPIEVAIDEMQTRVAELEDVVFTKPTDAKKLQLRLQGSVCVQVNAGPLAYANVFLDPTLSSVYPEDKVEDLKDIFRDFLKISYSALQINSKLIAQDQQEYQEVLRQNYKKLCSSLSALFGESLWPHEETGSFKRNSMGVFSVVTGVSHNSSTA
ncbi:dedicator of cytokinesis protein Ziz isoform X3 [Leptinotarsa decemlineata]|uniref:dedicator of cytokinesis protein Ziz isoform X3 n=1 Tax=Leptinotarsa decemlineata TaxID=7539 RepID=UPI003D30A1AD